MKTKRVIRIISKTINIVFPCIVIAGAIVVSIILQLISRPPFIADVHLRILISIFTNISFFTSGIISLIVAVRDRVVWLRNFQIAINCVMLISGLTAFLAYNNSVVIPSETDCTVPPSSTNSSDITCVCGTILVGKSCDYVLSLRSLASSLMLVYAAQLLFCFADLIKVFFLHPKRKPTEKVLNAEINDIEDSTPPSDFYPIPYPPEWVGRPIRLTA